MSKKKRHKKPSIWDKLWEKVPILCCLLLVSPMLLIGFLGDIRCYYALQGDNLVSQQAKCVSYELEYRGRHGGLNRYQLTLDNGDTVAVQCSTLRSALSLEKAEGPDALQGQNLTYRYVPDHSLLFSGSYVLASITDGSRQVLGEDEVLAWYQERMHGLALCLVVASIPGFLVDVIRILLYWMEISDLRQREQRRIEKKQKKLAQREKYGPPKA